MKTFFANCLGAALGLSILANFCTAEAGKTRSMLPAGSVLTLHLLSGVLISFNALTHGNGMWVAASGDTIFTSTDAPSTDGMEWTMRASGVGDELRDVCYRQGRFVAGGCRQTILTSKEGHRWTRTGPRHSVGLKAVAAGPDGFVAVGYGVILTSPDGRHWSRASIGSRADSLFSVAWRDDRWVAVGRSGVILTSMDGRFWTRSEGVTQFGSESGATKAGR